MAVPYIFVQGTAASADEVNANFRAVDNNETVLENSINIVKLQYCQSVTDIDHDYMIVDVFTDSTGYNNTVCTVDTTSTFCCSGLSGYYISYNISSNKVSDITSTCIGDCCSGCIGNNFVCATSTGGYNSWYCALHNGLFPCFSDICELNLRYCYILCICGSPACSLMSPGVAIRNVPVCFTDSISGNWSAAKNSVVCLKWKYVSENCWDYYINADCCGNICFETFPSPHIVASATAANMGHSWSCLCLTCVYYVCKNSSVYTVPFIYATTVNTIYMKMEKSDTGTVVYNVIDATTSNCIACNLPLNTLNTLDCCVCCHKYEIVQCSDGVSCIKSYALIAGEA